MLQRSGFSTKEIAYICKQLLIALSALHLHDIIHRDVKPDNILSTIMEPELGPRIKLADFGMSTSQ